MDYASDIQFIRSINQAVNCRVHNVSAVFYRILCIRNQDDIVVVLIFQSITFIASVLSQILLRILHKPLALIQTSFGDSYLLKTSLKEFVQRLSAFLPPAGSDPETAVFRVSVQTFHFIRNIIPECLASVYIGTDLMAVGSYRNVIPHAALIHGNGPRGIGHHVTVVFICRNELDLLAVGHRSKHSALLPFGYRICLPLSGNQTHPGVCCGPVCGEIINKLHCISVFKCF